MRLRLTFASYVRHMNGDIRRGTMQEKFCANTLSDLMGCRDCHWNIHGFYNQNLFYSQLTPTSWYGTIEIVNADNHQSYGVVNLASPNGRISCDAFGYFYGKVPNGNITIIVRAFEPCFGAGQCRSTMGGHYPRTLWIWEKTISAEKQSINLDEYLDEGPNGLQQTDGLC